MMIKYAIPKIEWAIEWAIELLYNSVLTDVRRVGEETSWGPEKSEKDVVEKATAQRRGPSGLPIELEIRRVGDQTS